MISDQTEEDKAWVHWFCWWQSDGGPFSDFSKLLLISWAIKGSLVKCVCFVCAVSWVVVNSEEHNRMILVSGSPRGRRLGLQYTILGIFLEFMVLWSMTVTAAFGCIWWKLRFVVSCQALFCNIGTTHNKHADFSNRHRNLAIHRLEMANSDVLVAYPGEPWIHRHAADHNQVGRRSWKLHILGARTGSLEHEVLQLKLSV